MRILIVEDERKVANFISQGLQEEGHTVEVAKDGEAALDLLRHGPPYDLIVLDVMLPRLDGVAVLRAARAARVTSPVLMLTARDTVADKVTGLDAGADDYLTKPFSFLELLARVRALLRRGTVEPQVKLQVGDLVIDLTAHRASRAGKSLQLTNKEFALIEFFMRNSGRVLTRTTIAEHVWDYRFEDTLSNVIDVFVNRLRNKIDRDFTQKLIHTVKGVGYVMREEEE